MVTFLHTADWQIGMTRRWLQGEAQARFADARVGAIRRLGAIAVEQGCEFVVVCGDVFESNQLSGQTVRRALEALREVPVPVYLLPGNHDPLDAVSLYRLPLFRQECPAHVHVLDTPGPVTIAEGVELVAAPWESKHPGEDLVGRVIADLGPADGTVRIVAGHGAVDALDPDRDNPAAIRLEPVERALQEGRIHYLALGDRHSRTRVGESGAVWYSGTPEVTDPREESPGDVLVVRVEDGSPPHVVPHHIGTWDFRVISRELCAASDVAALDAELSALQRKDRTVVRLALRGALGLAEHARLAALLAGHGEVLAALHDWDRHTDLAVVTDGTDLSALGLGGFVATAAEEIRGCAIDLEGSGIRDGESAAVVPPAPDLEVDQVETIDWSFDPFRPEDAESAKEALTLLYRFTTEAPR